MSLNHCGPVIPISRSHATQGLVNYSEIDVNYIPEQKRPLSVILAWLAAKEKYLEKYRQIWLQRGFDVLTVKLTPNKLLVPTLGSKKLITDLLKLLYASSKHYEDIVLHCFSVGAYEFGEMLTQLKDNNYLKQIVSFDKITQSEMNPKTIIERRIKGIILDSPVNVDGIGIGVSRAMSANPVIVQTLKTMINAHLKLSYNFATKYIIEAVENAHNNYLKVPSLIITSEKDKIGTPEMSLKLKHCWEQLGIPVDFKCFKNSGHVQHYAVYPDEYTNNIDNYLSKINLAM
ncbi:Transmembrane protein 53-like protein [Leptotrombidium deliense]|uniref:Transmembrane protein 53-like protein n=1 Tax=Leptotrombidium deliense TaxID=299467 RepID=A0A443S0G8_9ACAR|nr:Transmembrane protein 53-like protein [Leptotrombidium deliense]